MLTQEITSMKKQIDDAKKQTEAQGVNAGGYPNQANSRSARMFPGNSKNNQMPYQPNVMNHVHAEYVDIAAEEAVDEKTTENFVPSGTFAKAVLLSGADASAAVNSQTNPDPMLFRIVDNGTLPNDATSHLKDCLLTSAVTGDISSERGKIRFERMSCTKEDGSVLEVPVEGYVAGADGKNGIRGIPVWREGALTERAFIAGTLSGFSDAVQSQYVTTSTSALGSTETVNDGDSVRYGVANGFSSASDRLAKYYIQRAEQYHPVIQIGPGVVVDVVFLKGFYIDGVEHTGKSKAQARPVRTQQQMHTEAQQAATNLLSNLSQNPNR
ncbi:MAG: TraB/VirB10 family protein [Gammaproteobacteria bacterium]|nr:TraB/VirB10 family protein [Gammaproteobacteria bacterium]